MGVYAYAVVQDCVHGHRELIDVIDLQAAVREALENRLITPLQLQLVRLHVSGYALAELELSTKDAKSLLIAAYNVIGKLAGYEDESLVFRHRALLPNARVLQAAVLQRMNYYMENSDELN